MNRRSFLTLIPGGLAGMAVATHLPPPAAIDRATYSFARNRQVSDVDYWTNHILATRGDRPVHVDYWTSRMTSTNEPWPPMSSDEVLNVFDRVKRM